MTFKICYSPNKRTRTFVNIIKFCLPHLHLYTCTAKMRSSFKLTRSDNNFALWRGTHKTCTFFTLIKANVAQIEFMRAAGMHSEDTLLCMNFYQIYHSKSSQDVTQMAPPIPLNIYIYNSILRKGKKKKEISFPN